MNSNAWKQRRVALFLLLFLPWLFYTLVLGHIPNRHTVEKEATDYFAITATADADGKTTESVSTPFPADDAEFSFVGDGETLNTLNILFSEIPPEDAAVQLHIYRGDRRVWGTLLLCEELRENPEQTVYVNFPTKKGEAYRLCVNAVETNYIRRIAGEWNAEDPLWWELNRYVERAERAEAYDTEVYAAEEAPKMRLSRVEFRLRASVAERLRSLLRGLPWFLLLAVLLHYTFRPGRLGWTLMIFYTAFALAGSRTLLYPLYGQPSAMRVLLFFLVVIASALFVPAVTRATQYVAPRMYDPEKRLRKPLFTVLVVLAILLPAAIILYGGNPLFSSPDTITVLGNATKMGRMPISDWTPPLYVLYVRLAISVWPRATMIAFFNWACWLAVWLRIFFYLRQKGIRDGLLLAAAFFVGLFPANVFIINTGWKDVPFACGLLWSFLAMTRLVLDKEELQNRTAPYAELVLALIVTTGFRKNGIITMAFVCLFILFYLPKNRRRWIVWVGSLLGILVLNVALPSLIGAKKSVENNRATFGYMQDSLGAYFSGAELPEESLRFLSVCTYDDIDRKQYNPTYASYGFNADIPYKVAKVAPFALRSVVENPVLYLRVGLARNDLLWGIPPGKDVIIGTMNSIWNEEPQEEPFRTYLPPRKANAATKVMHFFERIGYTPLGLVIIWRTGAWLWAGVFALFIACRRGYRKKALALAVIPLSQIIGLWLTSGYQGEYRFLWPLNSIFMISVLLLPLAFREKQSFDHADSRNLAKTVKSIAQESNE